MKLVELLYIIAKAIQGLAGRLEQRRRQKERDELEDNPGEWFGNHFGGLPDASSEADKANARRDSEG